MDPLISVVMAVRNCERFVGQAIASVLGQTCSDFELIVVDDASTDATPAVLEQAARDPRVTVLRRTSPGVSAARNLAIAHARGEFIAFLDADDVWLPEKLARQRELFVRRPELALALTGYLFTDQSLRPRGIVRCTDFRGWLLLDGDGPALPSTAMFRRSALASEARFDESFSNAADLEFACRAAACGPVVAVEEPLTMYRTHGSQMSTDIQAYAQNVIALYAELTRRGTITHRQRNRGLANLNVRLCVTAVRRLRLVTATRHLTRAIRLGPTRLVALPLHALGRRLTRRMRLIAWARRQRAPMAEGHTTATETALVPADVVAPL